MSVQGPGDAKGPVGDGWVRLHPATPLLRGGVVLLAILIWIVVQLRDVLITLVVGDVVGEDVGIAPDPAATWVLGNAGIALGAVGLLIAVILVGGWLSWRMHTYRITEDVVEERDGIIWRKHRRARLDRIQGVNIERPLLARIFGAARVVVAVAGEDANIRLSYLSSAVANQLRADLLAAASQARAAVAADGEAPNGADAAGAHSSPVVADAAAAGAGTSIIGQRLQEFTAPELDTTLSAPDSIVRMHVGRLLGSTVMSIVMPLVLLTAATVVPVVIWREWSVLFAFIPILIGFGAFAIQRVSRSLRYSIASTPDGIRVGFGLLSTTNETLPPGRIHAIEMTQPLLWRPFGWWSVRINRASRSTSDAATGQVGTSILPVGDAADVVRVISLMLPGIDLRDAFGRSDQPAPLVDPDRAGDDERPTAEDEPGIDTPPPTYVTSPRRARVFRWFSWRRNGFAITDDAVIIRKGAIWRTITVVPLARIQSVAISSGPVARAARLRAVAVHTVMGTIVPSIGAIDENDARALWRDAEARALEAMATAR